MKQTVSRRNFLAAAGTATMAMTAAASLAAESTGAPKNVKILGIACSPRKGMTTAKAVQLALDAAKGVDARIEVELIDLGELSIAGYSPKPPMVVVGGNAPAFQGATVLSTKDDISADTLGLGTAKKLGAHVAEMALRLAPKEAQAGCSKAAPTASAWGDLAKLFGK